MSNATIIPIPQVGVSVREATLADVPFIDSLQRAYGKQLGFLATSWIENKVRAGQVLIACKGEPRVRPSLTGESTTEGEHEVRPYGYVIFQDKYLKREELGLIVQLCVAKGVQRKLVGATLLKAAFDRAAYGCRLFCLWCAQDIEANRFWESMGFVPLAYRAGSEKKRRVHIFWQTRIRAGDDATPWWFPSTTGAGAMRADRIVLPIPPGLRWDDEMPLLMLPGQDEPKRLPSPANKGQRTKDKGRAPVKVGPLSGGLMFAPPAPAAAKPERKPREKKPKVKNDPKLVAAARELRDRWLEQVNAGAYQIEDAGKYDVTRQRHLSATAGSGAPLLPSSPALLPAAA